MASKRTVDLLLADLGKVMGLEDLVFDDNDGCLLQFDDSLTVLLLYDAEANEIYFFSYVGEVPQQAMAHVSALLLEANYRWQATGGATLSLRPGGENDVVMTQKFSLEKLDSSNLQEYLGSFVMNVEKWTKFIEDNDEAPKTAQKVSAPGKEDKNGSSALPQMGAIRA